MSFTHRLTADAAYGSLLRHNRALLHSATAAALARRHVAGTTGEAQLLAVLARHYVLAGQWLAAHRWSCELLLRLVDEGRLPAWPELEAETLRLWQAARRADASLPEQSVEYLRARAAYDRLQGRAEDARSGFAQCLALARAAGDCKTESAALANLGQLERKRGALDAALDYTRSAATAAADDPTLSAVAQIQLGILESLRGNTELTGECFAEAHRLAQAGGNLRLAAIALGNLGLMHLEQGRLNDAGRLLRAALAAVRQVAHRPSEGQVLVGLARLALLGLRYSDAARLFHEARDVLRLVRDRGGEAEAVAGEAQALLGLGDLGEATRLSTEANAIVTAARLGLDPELSDRLHRLATALAGAWRAELRRPGQREPVVGVALVDLGLAEQFAGRLDTALDLYRLGLAAYRAAHYRRGEAFALNNIGLVMQELGREAEARAYFEHGLEVAQAAGESRPVGLLSLNLGLSFDRQGRRSVARKHYAAALDACRASGDRLNEGIVLGNLGKLEELEGYYPEAQTLAEQALAIARETNSARFEALWLANLARLAAYGGDALQARTLLAQAKTAGERSGDRMMLGTVLSDSAATLLVLDDKEAAAQLLQRAQDCATAADTSAESFLGQRLAGVRLRLLE